MRWFAPLLGLSLAGASAGQDPDPLRVRVELEPGPQYVGQGFELRASVVAAGRRPKVDPPSIDGAVVWTIGTELKPISSTGIGSIQGGENLFVSRFRVVARRPGTLVIPSVQVQTRDRSGHSQPLRALIVPVPLLDRPAEFLGGVGRFGLQADAVPKVVRAGQELAFRIKVTGPAAWGMTGRPELAHYERLGLGIRIEPEPDEVAGEPPERTFVYRLRPTRAGDAILPPVGIAAFDPDIKRYVTRVTAGVPIRVVAVPEFDPSTIADGESRSGSSRAGMSPWAAWGLSAILLLGSSALLARVRGRLRRQAPSGPEAARRYAARLGRGLESLPAHPGQYMDLAPGLGEPVEALGQPACDAARRVSGALIRYLELGIGRPAGALTPDEALEGVTGLTDSEELGRLAAGLAARCDLALYRGRAGEPDAPEILASARVLFQALGRVKRVRPGSS
jgi:hypothetical protein